MGRRKKTSKRSRAKTILRLPDLEQSKNAVLISLAAASSQESYAHAIDEFIGWYCSEPRLAFNRSVVLRYRFFLEQKNLAPSTINVRLAAVRRLAHEAADTGLLSPELAAGIGRVKGAKRLGVRIGNWLSVEYGVYREIMSEILFATQGDYGIDAGGTAGGNVAGEQCHTTKKHCDSGKNERISAGNSEEQAIHQTHYREGSRET